MDLYITTTNSCFLNGFYSFVLSVIFCYLLLKESVIPSRYSKDVCYGSQKIHVGNIKRIGGLSIVSSIIIFNIIDIYIFNNKYNLELNFLALYCFIIFLIGFTEDLIKDIKPTIRLLLLFIITFWWIVQSENLIRSTNIDLIDSLIEIEIFAILLTLICIISSINATNMMDGANGLLTIFATSVCLILSFYAHSAGDFILLNFLFITVGSFLGFLIFNWPKGIIFLGDGGSYFIGAYLSTLLIFISNDLNNFSMLNALVIMSYPVWELMFTVFRRVFSSSQITEPDNLHLHTIIHSYIKRVNWVSRYYINRNAFSAIIINLIALVPSIFFLIHKYDNDLQDQETILFFIFCFISYTILYLILRKKKQI